MKANYHGASLIILANDGTWAINQRGEINPRHAATITPAIAKAAQALRDAQSTATPDALTCLEGRLEQAATS